jgi:hypothetical protein
MNVELLVIAPRHASGFDLHDRATWQTNAMVFTTLNAFIEYVISKPLAWVWTQDGATRAIDRARQLLPQLLSEPSA